VDLTNKNISGKEAEELLGRAGITVNKNAIPFDTQSRYVTSGVRIGTPLVTTRGMRAQEMEMIADFINRVIQKRDEKTIQQIRLEILRLCQNFPLSNIVARI
jgi:glycine hydroxymethyltransferase